LCLCQSNHIICNKKVLFCYYQGQIEDYCYNESTTIWGSFNPVLSPSSHRVYRNKVCAECHGVYDGVPFDKLLQCKSSKSNSLGMKSFDQVLIEAYSNFIKSGCSVTFYLPKKAKEIDLRPVICYPSIQSLFSNRPQVDNRKEMCERGPLMPYPNNRSSIFYRNFYCSGDDIPKTGCANETGFYIESYIDRETGKVPGTSNDKTMFILFGENVPSMNRSTVANKVHLEACLIFNYTKVGRFAINSSVLR